MNMTTQLMRVTASLVAASFATAASMPFENDFSTVGFSTESGFRRQAATETYRRTIAGDTRRTLAPAYGTEQFENHANNSFTAKVQFTFSSLSSYQNNGSFLGYALFGSDAALSGGQETPYLLADFRYGNNQGAHRGLLRFRRVDDSTTLLGTGGRYYDAENQSGRSAVRLNTTYTLVLVVKNTGANTYDMTLTLFDAAGTTQLGSPAILTGFQPPWPEPAGGFHFGVRTTVEQAGGTTDITLDNFSVSTDPSTRVLLGFAFLGVLGFARRR